jgi:hypothetical protein
VESQSVTGARLVVLAVAAQSLPSLKEGQKQSLKLIAEEIVKKQQADGSWEFFATLRRPPINESQTTDAAWIIMALEGETGPDAPESQRAALSKAITWLDTAKRSDIHQDKVLKVLRGVRSAKPRKTMQTTIDELLALQRADGGWSQTVPELKSDAFATGQTLYVLSLAGFTAERPEIKRGIDFLVTTQKPDGSWPMISRSTPDGSPGSSKLLTPITCAASSWATLGLARLVPKEKPASKADADRNAQKIPTKIAGTYYGLSLEELDRRAGEFNPVENLAPLAKAGAKILHLHGDGDTLVPTRANSRELARRYREFGGEAEIVLLKDLGAGRANSRGHDGPELYESVSLLKFLLAD